MTRGGFQRAALPVLAACLLSGCSLFRVSLEPEKPPGEKEVSLSVPFFPDNTDQCGPPALASVLEYWGKPEAPARQALPDAGALKPYVLETLANVLLRQGRYAEAAAAIDEAEAGTPADNGPVRGQLLETRRNIDSARAKESYNSDRDREPEPAPPAGERSIFRRAGYKRRSSK